MNPQRTNPYMGPEAFSREDAALFFGRRQELRDLVALAATERLLLFYAPSGAGKTSLLNAKLIPALEEKLYEMLPVARVSGASEVPATVRNVYTYNIMVGLARGEPDPERFAQLSLSDFLWRLSTDDGQHYALREGSEAMRLSASKDELWPRVLVLDQFEEIITTYPTFWRHREDFFRQLDEAMRADALLRVVLCLRSDFVQDLDRYTGLLENGLRSRYHMLPMGTADGLAAIEEPARAFHHPFDEVVARRLLENLSQVREQEATGQVHMVEGEWVEPIQLQVVCYQLWERLRERLGPQPGERIDAEDLQALAGASELASGAADKAPPGEADRLSGFVDGALASFYEDALALALATTPGRVDEAFLRDWFSTKLVTDSGTRGFLQRGTEETAGVPEAMVRTLVDRHLLRGDVRGGTRLVELVHDRFVAPIRRSNRLWTEQRMKDKPWLAAAYKWHQSGASPGERDAGLLLRGAGLTDVLAETKGQRLDAAVAEYLVESDRARQRRWIRWLTAASVSVAVVAVTTIIIFVRLLQAADANAHEAQVARSEAQSLRLAFQSRSSLAQAAQGAEQSGVELALLLAIEAMDSTATLQAKLAMLEALGQSRRQRRDGLSLAADPRESGAFLSVTPLSWPFSPTVVSVSPNGRRVAGATSGQPGGSDGSQATVWVAPDDASGEPATHLVPTTLAKVTALALSHDGLRLAIAGCDELEEGLPEPEADDGGALQMMQKLPKSGPVESTPCSAAKKRLELWELGAAPGTPPIVVAQAEGLLEEVRALEFHTYDSRTLLSGGIDGTIREWHVEDQGARPAPPIGGSAPMQLVPQVDRQWLHGPSPLADLAMDAGSKVAALGTSGAVKVFSWDDLKGVGELPADGRPNVWYQGIAFLYGGDGLATSMTTIAACDEDSLDICHESAIDFRDWQNAPDAAVRLSLGSSVHADPLAASEEMTYTQSATQALLSPPPTDLRFDPEHEILMLASPDARAAWWMNSWEWRQLACAGARRNLSYAEWTAAFPDQVSDSGSYLGDLTCSDAGVHVSFAAERINEAREKINDCTVDGLDAGLSSLGKAREIFGDAAASLGLPADEDYAGRVLLQAQAAALASRDAPLASNCRLMAQSLIERTRPDWPGMATALDLGLTLARAEARLQAPTADGLGQAFDDAERVSDQREAWPFDLSAGLARVYAAVCLGIQQASACQRLEGLVTRVKPDEPRRAILDSEAGATWIVKGERDSVLEIEVVDDETESDPQLGLYGPGGDLLVLDDTEAGDRSAYIGPFRLPDSGDYFVQIGGQGSLGATHVYTLAVALGQPTPIELGQTLPVRDLDAMWSFDAQTDQVIELSLTSNGAGRAPVLNLFDEFGTLLASSEDEVSGRYAHISEFVVPETGRFFVRAESVDPSADPAARYSLALSAVESTSVSEP
jgi:hypothetical protein